ncbi:MAG: HSP20 family molecular chaperone IbpA [uncultured Thiotrichaceae bacterium]|uniref:HSP20 family molecular chaperone IbpA n=1 Tax=uncultured Thiotrichaceae bacterium TaxID=298394 RepID=A0A6S6T8C8_9GAMM|nr:MAG: HSP20 family molecular chaperone IbpA [uncultured Thiotrichaceae bacterium]
MTTDTKIRQNDNKVEKTVTTKATRPAVDIYENVDTLTLYADMPGVSAENLDIQVENNQLTIEANAQIELADDMKAVYAENRTARYRRSFTLSNKLDQDKIQASVSNGVLTLTIAKSEAAKPRKIEIKTAA